MLTLWRHSHKNSNVNNDLLFSHRQKFQINLTFRVRAISLREFKNLIYKGLEQCFKNKAFLRVLKTQIWWKAVSNFVGLYPVYFQKKAKEKLWRFDFLGLFIQEARREVHQGVSCIAPGPFIEFSWNFTPKIPTNQINPRQGLFRIRNDLYRKSLNVHWNSPRINFQVCTCSWSFKLHQWVNFTIKIFIFYSCWCH